MIFVRKSTCCSTSRNFYNNANNEKYTNDRKENIAIGFLKFLTHQTIAKAVRYRNRDDGRNCSTIIFTIKKLVY